MFENIINFFKKAKKKESSNSNSKDTAKERLHLVLMQDRANVSADFLDLMRQEIIEVIKKYIDIDESAMDVRLTNQAKEDGTQGAPALYANIPIINIKDESKNIKKEIEVEEQSIEEEGKKEAEVQEKEDRVSQQEKVDKESTEFSESVESQQQESNKTEQDEKIEEAKKIVQEEQNILKAEAEKKAQ